MNIIIDMDNYELVHKTAVQSAKSLHVLLFFAEQMNENNQYSESTISMAEKLDCSSATIEKAIKVLQKNGLVEIGKQCGKNLYTVNSEIIRKSE